MLTFGLFRFLFGRCNVHPLVKEGFCLRQSLHTQFGCTLLWVVMDRSLLRPKLIIQYWTVLPSKSSVLLHTFLIDPKKFQNNLTFSSLWRKAGQGWFYGLSHSDDRVWRGGERDPTQKKRPKRKKETQIPKKRPKHKKETQTHKRDSNSCKRPKVMKRRPKSSSWNTLIQGINTIINWP